MSGIKFLTKEEEYAYLTDLAIHIPNELIKPLQLAAFNSNLIDYHYYIKAVPINSYHSTLILMTQELPGLNEIEKYYWFIQGFLSTHPNTVTK